MGLRLSDEENASTNNIQFRVSEACKPSLELSGLDPAFHVGSLTAKALKRGIRLVGMADLILFGLTETGRFRRHSDILGCAMFRFASRSSRIWKAAGVRSR